MMEPIKIQFMFHQNTQLVETRNRPFTTDFPNLLPDHEKWVRGLVEEKGVPNGEDVVKAIMFTVKKLFRRNDCGGNIKLSFKGNGLQYEVTHYPLKNTFMDLEVCRA